MNRTDITLIEANILAIHPNFIITERFGVDMEMILNHYISFPIYAHFIFKDKQKIERIETKFECGYIADIVVPNFQQYYSRTLEIRQKFENILVRNDKRSKNFLIEDVGIHSSAFQKDYTYTTLSNRHIYREEYWDEAGAISQTLCIFDFVNNPSIQFANTIKRLFVALIYGFYKYGTSSYGAYLLPSLDILYDELHQDDSIKSEIKELIEEDLILE